ncbi:MAG: helix-turn-helix domain-containing protein [Bacteroidales bacterium]|jgi:transcriptional regulator with XRE-family HTH domain|nr:helix-turn-helix domain-containing protein [Bacteroidales bacterium]
MKERILAFLQSENKSYAQFAEEIGVQPSGISHILSGRNNPSLDFVVKMLHKYTSLSAEWLLFGRGAMYKYASQPTLFETEPQITVSEDQSFIETTERENGAMPPVEGQESASGIESNEKIEPERAEKRLTRVLMFYSDKTFTEYRPS